MLGSWITGLLLVLTTAAAAHGQVADNANLEPVPPPESSQTSIQRAPAAEAELQLVFVVDSLVGGISDMVATASPTNAPDPQPTPISDTTVETHIITTVTSMADFGQFKSENEQLSEQRPLPTRARFHFFDSNVPDKQNVAVDDDGAIQAQVNGLPFDQPRQNILASAPVDLNQERNAAAPDNGGSGGGQKSPQEGEVKGKLVATAAGEVGSGTKASPTNSTGEKETSASSAAFIGLSVGGVVVLSTMLAAFGFLVRRRKPSPSPYPSLDALPPRLAPTKTAKVPQINKRAPPIIAPIHSSDIFTRPIQTQSTSANSTILRIFGSSNANSSLDRGIASWTIDVGTIDRISRPQSAASSAVNTKRETMSSMVSSQWSDDESSVWEEDAETMSRYVGLPRLPTVASVSSKNFVSDL
ncbi:hypothetical protein HDU97_007236 [Phlyctochytrium planicorne]|nr:hypothetical protein HDU97_007236 [Phlyctochytrium planicorne]